MHDRPPTVAPSSPTRWTEDRVERLMLALFAEQPVTFSQSACPTRSSGARHAVLVAVAAACLAIIVPVLSARVDESADDQTPLARWVGPRAIPTVAAMNLAAADDAESMTSDSEGSDDESDETAEAPVADAEESAST
ncbi:MAG: hypothetical protein Q8K78_03910 [Planctomycetaceae bacterium]|nr:hypothetical protein [Planctomycetaceae bacterium]